MSGSSGPHPPPFTAEIVNAANPVVIRASGELDIATVGSLQTCLESAASNGGPVEVDMTEVTFMDSSGLRALIIEREAADGAGRGFVVVPSEAVRRLITIAGLSDFIEMREAES